MPVLAGGVAGVGLVAACDYAYATDQARIRRLYDAPDWTLVSHAHVNMFRLKAHPTQVPSHS